MNAYDLQQFNIAWCVLSDIKTLSSEIISHVPCQKQRFTDLLYLMYKKCVGSALIRSFSETGLLITV